MTISKKAPTGNVNRGFSKEPHTSPSSLDVPTDDFSKSFMYSVYQLQFLINKRLENLLLKEKSVSFSQFMILVGFECANNGKVSQSDIAQSLYLTEATVSRHISVLTKTGLLTQTLDAQNRRKRIIAMTPRGKIAFMKANATVTKELSTIFSVLSAVDRASIMKNFSLVLPQLLTKK